VEKGIQLLSLELADNVEDVNTLIRSVQHEQFMDNMYWSRKNWRMTVIDEYLTSQRQALQTALTGSCEESKALAILSTTHLQFTHRTEGTRSYKEAQCCVGRTELALHGSQ
jgi:hypothetical protein